MDLGEWWKEVIALIFLIQACLYLSLLASIKWLEGKVDRLANTVGLLIRAMAQADRGVALEGLIQEDPRHSPTAPPSSPTGLLDLPATTLADPEGRGRNEG